jgi:3-hydroxyisobutyrate dehydrogenase
MTKISFIGLGHMGSPMALNLRKAGFELTVYDVMPQAMQALVPHGCIPAASLREAIQDADVVITMLQTGQQVSEVCLSESGIFKHAKSNVLYIDSSSIEIATTLQLHQEAERLGIAMVDAPVSGGVTGAEKAMLTVMVGGTIDNYEKALPYLTKIGKKIVHAGGASHGQAAKICNNLILGISMIGVCEGFNLAKKLGLNPQQFFEISSNASGQCWAMTSYCPEPDILDYAPSTHHYQPGFMAKMMLKDLRLGQQAAANVGAAIPLGTEAAELYSLFVNEGNGEVDFSGIIKMLAERDRI